MRSSFILAGLSLVLGFSCRLNAQCHFAKTNATTVITYRFRPEISPEGLLLHVTMEFKSGADGVQKLLLQMHWAGKTLLSRQNLHIVSIGASSATSPYDESLT